MISLTNEQRTFFTQIADLAFVNPFSKEREEADWRILKQSPKAIPISERRDMLAAKLAWHFQELSRQDRFDIRNCRDKAKEIMRLAWVIHVFYEYRQRFDDFIKAQRRAGGKTLELPFAHNLLGQFDHAGYTRQEAAHFIALLFQYQRAFNFIDEAVSGNSDAMVDLRQRLWHNIFTFNPEWYLDYLCNCMEDFSLLLLGETGTGKSLVAKAVGCSGYIPFDASTRKFTESFTGSFQAINLSQFSPGVLESELFGHKKGAFTGAIDSHPGLFAKCSRHGSVFIDEIGDIDIPVQVKLLNVLQDRVFSPVGSHEKHRFEGRVISATNRPIEKLLASGQFRADFYYRLCSDVITLPSLRQRISENPLELRDLITRLLQRVIDNPDEELAARIESRIHAVVPKAYPWPGNVRELEQSIRQICLTGAYEGQQPASRKESNQNLAYADDNGNSLSAQQVLQAYCRRLYDQNKSYEAVARIAGLDRRTVKKYIDQGEL